jgi:trehalose/maltose transport system substrate-binding protein
VGNYIPPKKALWDNPEVVKVMPYLQTLKDVKRVYRPSVATDEKYNQVSISISMGLSRILFGGDTKEALRQVDQDIHNILSSSPPKR